ncbi:MAG: hypothetical protein BWX84_00191 [Verrucomicrobia bacterium ADurb.Bin118]|nr:MAG: hypothetical protein BWX84_00191 [Verrucomicrobia bacterium ADurb.Bin118]
MTPLKKPPLVTTNHAAISATTTSTTNAPAIYISFRLPPSPGGVWIFDLVSLIVKKFMLPSSAEPAH